MESAAGALKHSQHENGAIHKTGGDYHQNHEKDRFKLTRLRYFLATEGCMDSQVSLARSFLEEATSTPHERSQNCVLAVGWLLLAAEEGHKEALTLLETCYHNGIGITKANRAQVETCLSSSEDEKLAHHVGSSVFRMLTYDTQDAVPLNFFRQKVNSLGRATVEIVEELGCTQYVTVSEVVTAILQCLRHEPPGIDLVSDTKVHFQRNGKLWRTFCISLVTRCIDNVQSEFSRLDVTVGVVLASCIVVITPSWETVPYRSWVCGVSLTAMAFVTARISKASRDNMNIQRWQKTIKHFLSDVTFSKPKGWLLPEYILFIVALLVYLGSYNSATAENISNFVTMFIVAMILALNLQASQNKTVKASLAFHILLAVTRSFTLPFGLLPVYAFWEISAFGVHMTTNVVLLCTLLFCIPYYQLAKQHELVPHLMTIAWIRVLVSLLAYSNLLTTLLFISSALIAAKKYSLTLNFAVFLALNALFTHDGLFSFPFLFIFIASRYVAGCLLKKTGAKIFLLLLLLLPILLPRDNPNRYILEWEQYAKFCYGTSRQPGNTAQIQDVCSRFRNSAIMFEGSIAKIERHAYHNYVEGIVSAVPFSCKLRCILGEEYQNRDTEFTELLHRVQECPCHLEKWQAHVYSVFVTIKTTFRIIGEVEVRVGDECKSFVYGLQEGDVILLKGSLDGKVGTSRPRVTLLSAKCLNCIENVSCSLAKSTWEWDKKEFVANVVDFFLGPFVAIVRPK